ncbi:uncharacterized protein LOC105441013 [Strongylocentrotus purpuratus]|uniref:Uncharacterized protein n=1 Tax=Strongylocentrotus purpuratus TaxID=7668 RepID=A0A7M7MZM5_STRPU|nr:uncharacterized protein LOC105441013 [Strongylocentrotus purpuratus]
MVLVVVFVTVVRVEMLFMFTLIIFVYFFLSDSTACKCRTGNQKCWTKCARIYQSKRRAESPRSEQPLPDILKQSSEIDDIRYEDLVDTNQRNSADSPSLEELLDSLPFPWRRNIYRLIQEAEMAELENFL